MEKIKKPFFRRKSVVILIIVFVVLIATSITAFALRNQIMRGILGPTKYYLVKESLNISSLSEEDFSLDGSLTLGEDYSSILVFTGADQAEVDMNVQWSNTEDKKKINMDLLGLLKLEAKAQGDLVSLSVNGHSVTDGYETDKNKKKGNNVNSNTEKETLSTWDKFMWIWDLTNSPVIEEIEENCVTTSETDYNGIECTVDTYKITGKNMSVILNSLAKRIDEDETTKKLYEEYLSKNMLMGYLGISDTEDASKYLKDKADECLKSQDVIEYTVYYDDGEIVNREYKSSENTCTLGSYNKDKDKYISFGYNSINGDFKVTDTPDVSDVNIKKTESAPMNKIFDALEKYYGNGFEDEKSDEITT